MYEMIKLKYNYKDFEPYISEETMKYHYEVLYKGYKENYNKTLDEINNARALNKYTYIKLLEKNLSYYGAGAVLHELFFENLEKHSSAISNELSQMITHSFGTFNNLKEQFINNILNIEGSGWGIMGYSPILKRLIILQAEKHQDQTIWDMIPILVIDMWEHAYYLDYKTDKKTYIDNIFNLINWQVVNERFKKAMTLTY